MDIWHDLLKPALLTVVIGFVSLGMFFFAYRMLEKLMPFSIQKELEEDHNVSVGIVVGAFIIGLAIVIAAVARGA